MKKISVLGVGSPFGDDQVGWKVVDNLQAFHLNRLVTFKKLNRPHLQLIEEIQNGEIVYIIDAMKSGLSLGSIKRLTLDDINACDLPISTHDFGVIQSLQLASALNQLPNQLILYGVEIGEIEKSDTLSKEITSAISKITRILINELGVLYTLHKICYRICCICKRRLY